MDQVKKIIIIILYYKFKRPNNSLDSDIVTGWTNGSG